MENETRLRLFIRQTLNEVAAKAQDIEDPEESEEQETIDENTLDDGKKQGVDKVFEKINKKLK